jgi:hypothetical protein
MPSNAEYVGTSVRLLDRDWEYVIGVLLVYKSKRATALADQIDSELHGTNGE